MTNKLFQFKNGSFSCTHNVSDVPRRDSPMHTHDWIELYYFISGDCVCLVEGTEYKLFPQDIMIIRPFEAHTMRWFSSAPYERKVFAIPTELVSRFDENIISFLNDRPLGTNNRFTAADFGYSACAECMQSIGDGITEAGLISRVMFILTEAQRISTGRNTFVRAGSVGARMIDFVNQNLCDTVTAESVGERFFLSGSQVNRIFRHNTGSSLKQYLTAKRLLLARTRIRAGEPAMLVASECGYADYTSFYRAYIKYFGFSPSGDRDKTTFS